jgi:PAP2 superfamily
LAFSSATILSYNIDEWWSYAGFYSMAGLVAGARIYKDQHWLSDVVMGACIGTLSALNVLDAEKDRNTGLSFLGKEIIFYPTANGIGITAILD